MGTSSPVLTKTSESGRTLNQVSKTLVNTLQSTTTIENASINSSPSNNIILPVILGVIGGVLVIACIIAFMVYRRRTGVSGTPTPTEQDVGDFEITRKEGSHIYDRVE